MQVKPASCIQHKKGIENMLSAKKLDTWFDSTRGLDADGVISRFGETERRGGAQ